MSGPDDLHRMLNEVIGPSASRLFEQDLVPRVRQDGRTIRCLVLRCAWCREVVKDSTDHHVDPPITVGDVRSLQRHDARCRVADLLARHAAGESVSADFEQITRILERREP